METNAQYGDEQATSKGLRDRRADTRITLPAKKLSTIETIATGLSMRMFELSNSVEEEVGSVSTGSGLGSDWIVADWTTEAEICVGTYQ